MRDHHTIDLKTNYLGLRLPNPLVVGASPLSEDLDNIREMEDAGAAAVVMHSLFEEQIADGSHGLRPYLDHGTEHLAEAVSYFPPARDYPIDAESYLEKIVKAKEAVDIPIIGSLNGVSAGGWTRYARLIEEAGADALELNVYYIPTDAAMPGAKVEEFHASLVRAVNKVISMPMAVKIGPYFSNPANLIFRMQEEGAAAAVLFNRFYQPDIDVETGRIHHRITLSTSDDLLLPMRWTALLYRELDISLAISGGVHSHIDLVKSILAGATVAMMTSELLGNGIGRIGEVLEGMRRWMQEHEYESINELRGKLTRDHVAEPTAFERANYVRVLQSWER